MKNQSMRINKILVCCGPGCLSNDSLDIYEALKNKIESDKPYISIETTVKATGCHGFCEIGPLIKFLPLDFFYCNVKVSDVEEIYQKTIKNGEIIERLLYHDQNSNQKIKSPEEAGFYKGQKKIALRNVGEIDPLSIDDYMKRGGYKALKKALLKSTTEQIISEVEESGLRGRGGAGFPTGFKWRQCAQMQNFPKYIICNGDEGDPGAFMDRSILEGDPHSIIEGMVIGAYAVDSHSGFMYIRDEYFLAIKNMTKALEQARNYGYLGQDILGSGYDFDIQIVRGGGAFVCGESTALMASIEGRVGEPRAKYIRSVEKGLWDKPTVLNNVETWANIPVIINEGASRFKSIGTAQSPGTKVFSLVGKVKNTGLIEVPMGMTLRQIIYDIGGGIALNKKFKAVQTGGPSGGCIPEQLLDLKVDFDSLDKAGSMMGSGGMIVMDETTCMVDVAKYYLAFLSEESCGKCVPCREGIRRILVILEDICNGRAQDEDLDLLIEICETVQATALCGLGKTAPNPVITTIKYFKDEYIAHIRDKRCPAGVCKELTIYSIDKDKCKSCGLCAKNCPSSAIKQEQSKIFTIDQTKCTKCGACVDICNFHAVKIGGALACR
ncbi:MAG: NADH-ubiquinone oxidoreductase-F iron-sulfur binding region domain-containing protein [Tepidanaerobacteraceae bacterium]|jgi:NADH:ubiquinone oxidoreductase subunit F (NADH-binding)/(2Fe-2S) ferredoxin/NAD-dependent dihydropyrimidine dehydrogenase PreA subunit